MSKDVFLLIALVALQPLPPWSDAVGAVGRGVRPQPLPAWADAVGAAGRGVRPYCGGQDAGPDHEGGPALLMERASLDDKTVIDANARGMLIHQL